MLQIMKSGMGAPTFADASAVRRDLVQEGWSELVRVRIGRMGMSVSGDAVRPMEPLPNRAVQGTLALEDVPLV